MVEEEEQRMLDRDDSKNNKEKNNEIQIDKNEYKTCTKISRSFEVDNSKEPCDLASTKKPEKMKRELPRRSEIILVRRELTEIKDTLNVGDYCQNGTSESANIGDAEETNKVGYCYLNGIRIVDN
ncbi:hypothetical protein F8M41_019383 [Gigaspora margarita]|uniref:Uncharacterized protein n=1 Tax=Gigaspora margarita TaxID=4874 RepID=A0A8H4B5A3_GIGMA|nr:hypothetical protein F8M41_019383 [Gigaspora margarita]